MRKLYTMFTTAAYELLTKVGIKQGQDKVLHAIFGFLIGSVVGIGLGGAVGFLVVFGFAIGKELLDKFTGGTVDYFDMFFTLLAGVLGIMLFLGLIHLTPLFTVGVSTPVFLGILAVYAALIYYLFSYSE